MTPFEPPPNLLFPSSHESGNLNLCPKPRKIARIYPILFKIHMLSKFRMHSKKKKDSFLTAPLSQRVPMNLHTKDGSAQKAVIANPS